MPGFQPIPGFGDDDDSSASEDPGVAPPGQQYPVSTDPVVSPSTAIPSPPIRDPALPVPAAATSTTPRTRAGAAVVVAGVGLGAGALLGGLWGAGSGLLFAGAAMNSIRARTLWQSTDPASRSEAVKTTVMAIVGIAGAGYLGYRAREAQYEDDIDEDD